jgi:hypothetical protein
VSFSEGTDPDLDLHDPLEGVLQLWRNNWLSLRDTADHVFGGRYIGSDECLGVGSTILMPTHVARILHVDLDPFKVCSPTRTLVPEMNWLWKVSYSTFKDLDRSRLKAYDGTMILWCVQKCLILKNAKGAPIGIQSVSSEMISNAAICFKVGTKLKFPAHSVHVGICISSPPMNELVDSFATKTVSTAVVVADKLMEDPAESNNDITSSDDVEEPASAVFESMSMGLDFSVGIDFAKFIKKKYLAAVHPSRESGHFTMVVSFGRANFKLSE